MVIPLKKWLRFMRYLLVFFVFVYVFSRLFNVFEVWIKPEDPYRLPEGNAVKAGVSAEQLDSREGMLDRLKVFYQLGE